MENNQIDLSKVNFQTEEQPTEQPASTEPIEQQTEQPKEVDFKELTGGKFENVESLWESYQQEISKENPYSWLDNDDFARGAVEYYKSTGDLTPYLEAKTVDWTKVSDMELVVNQIKSRFEGFEGEHLERAIQEELSKQFNYDPEEEDEQERDYVMKKIGLAAEKIRKEKIESQSKFAAPDRSAEATKIEQEWYQKVAANEATKKLESTGKLTFQFGDESFFYEVDPQQVVQAAKDNTTFWELFKTDDPNNTVDLAKYYMTVAFAKDPNAFFRAAATYGKNLGKETILDTVTNPGSKDQKNITGGGSGNQLADMLSAALNQKK